MCDNITIPEYGTIKEKTIQNLSKKERNNCNISNETLCVLQKYGAPLGIEETLKAERVKS